MHRSRDAAGFQPWLDADPALLVEAARAAEWKGQANALSPSRVDWPIIDQVARATRRVRAARLPGSAEPALQF